MDDLLGGEVAGADDWGSSMFTVWTRLFTLFQTIDVTSKVGKFFMREMKPGLDWNRHHGVGATLLENWVEERAVGALIEEERADISKLSRYGHKVMGLIQDLLVNSKKWNTPKPTTLETQESVYKSKDSKAQIKSRRAQLEAELLKMAM